jgi:hypothetical protein
MRPPLLVAKSGKIEFALVIFGVLLVSLKPSFEPIGS